MLSVGDYLPSQAQQKPIPIYELKVAPADVRARMPRRSRSLRFGICKIGPNHSAVFLHLYAVSLGRRVTAAEKFNVANPSQYKAVTFLALFSRSGNTRYGKLHLLNTIRLVETQDRYATRKFVTFPAIRWLDLKHQRIPVFISQVSGGGGFGGHWVLSIFGHGISKKPIVQKFLYRHNLSQGINYSFAKTDKRGFMIVSETYWSYGTNITTHYFWNGVTFVKPGQKKSNKAG